MDSKQIIFFIFSIIITIGEFVTEANDDLPTYKCKEPSGYDCTLENIHLNKTHFNFNIESNTPLEVRWVNVYNSIIPVLSSEICTKFPNVESIVLQDLEIEDILYGAFYNCTKVRNLFIDRNRIWQIRQGTFSNNKEIVRLELQSNRLRTIGDPSLGDVYNMPKLDMLLLYNNYLKEFHPIMFRFSHNLQQLNIVNNDISDIDEQEILERFPNLQYFAYTANPLSCHRVAQINQAFEEADIKRSIDVPVTRTRFYPQQEYQNVTCLNDDDWLKAKARSDKTY